MQLFVGVSESLCPEIFRHEKGLRNTEGLCIHDGGDEGDRTPDLLTASQALSQLSYAPVRRSTIRELPRRCKDNFGKTSAGARAPESRGVAAAAPPAYQAPLRSPPGSPPRNRPIYYVWPASPDHGVSGKNKTDAPISCQEAVCGSVLSNSHRSS